MKPFHALGCLFLLLAHSFSSSQHPVHFASSHEMPSTEKAFFRLGDNLLTIATLSQPSEKSFVIVSLHHNELSATEAAKDFIKDFGGQLVTLENDENHNIDFEFFNSQYSIDPNKIFTQKGRSAFLKSGPYKNSLSVEVQRFADYFYESIPYNKHVIGVHSHVTGKRTILNVKNRKSPGKIRSVYVHAGQNENNYFVTTDTGIFNELKEKGFNVILQSPVITSDDGSLSILINKSKRIYIDVVAEEGLVEEHKKMIAAVSEILDR